MDIFLSYSWLCSRLADSLENKIKEEPAFHVIRDIHSVGVAENLHQFMDYIRDTFCSIVLINEAYLRSQNCIYELIALSKERNFNNKVIPIIIKGTDIFSESSRLRIVEYWVKSHIKSLSFEPVELRHVLEMISNLVCIICDQSSDIDIEYCERKVMETLFQRVFQKEIRPLSVTPHQIPLPQIRCLCIDFGTSYTLAAVMGTDGRTYMVRDCLGEISFPSIIELHKDGSYAIGNAVSNRMTNPNTYVVRELKRTIFKQDFSTYGPYQFSTKLLVAMLLQSVKKNAEEFFGVSFNESLLSIPVDFRAREVELLKTAAETVGLKVYRIIQESSTSALLITAHAKATECSYFLNIDMGGGTVDISAADCSDGVCDIFFSIGDRSLGSVDYDHAICEYIIAWLEQEHKLPTIYSDSALYANILLQAEQAKISLGASDSTIINIEVPNQMGDIEVYTQEITRQLYTEITSTVSTRLKTILNRVKELLKKCELDREIMPIYLTGQGSKLFLIRQVIQEIFPSMPLIDKYQESAVCQGLALQGGILSGVKKLIGEIVLLDNFRSYIDILCQRYDQERNIIYIGSENNTFHRLIDPYANSTITIPTRIGYTVSFTEAAIKKECEIILYDFNPSDNSRTKILSISVPAKTLSKESSILVVDVNANGEINAAIYTEEEYKKNPQTTYFLNADDGEYVLY